MRLAFRAVGRVRLSYTNAGAWTRLATGASVLVVAVPSLVYGLYGDSSTADWGAAGLVLPGHLAWRDVLTDREWPRPECIPVSDLLADFPVSVLLGVSEF